MEPKEREWENVYWIYLAEGRDNWRAAWNAGKFLTNWETSSLIQDCPKGSNLIRCTDVCDRSRSRYFAYDPLICVAVLWPSAFFRLSRERPRDIQDKALRDLSHIFCKLKLWHSVSGYRRLRSSISPRKTARQKTQCHIPRTSRSYTTPLLEPTVSRVAICEIWDSRSGEYKGCCWDVTPCRLV